MSGLCAAAAVQMNVRCSNAHRCCVVVVVVFFSQGLISIVQEKTNICIAYTIFNHSQSGLVTVPFPMQAQVIDIRPQNYTYSAVSYLPLSCFGSSKDNSADGSKNAAAFTHFLSFNTSS